MDSHSEWKGRYGLSKVKIKKIAAGARAAIRMHSSTGNVEALRKDLRNGPYHVFGYHRKCSPTFCKVKQATLTGDCDLFSSRQAPDSNFTQVDSNEEISLLCEIADQLDSIADDDINKEDEENSRLGGQYVPDKLPAGLMNAILQKGDRIVSLAGQLVTKKTSNLAETYMSANAKFNGGKQLNRIQRGSFENRYFLNTTLKKPLG